MARWRGRGKGFLPDRRPKAPRLQSPPPSRDEKDMKYYGLIDTVRRPTSETERTLMNMLKYVVSVV